MKKLRADRRIGLLLAGVVLLTCVAIGATVALPASDASLQAKPRRLSTEVRRGMKVYQSEGCWYCHSQYDRETKVDAGTPLRPSAYAGLSPAMLGFERIGPDLTHGPPTLTTSGDVVSYLGKVHGSMPAYAYLTDKDLRALAAYLVSLR